MRDSLLSVRLFGSHARGDADERSDVDVLCVLDSVDDAKKAFATSLISTVYKSPSIAFFGTRRLRTMYEEGHLFAWHIYRESRPLPGIMDGDWIAQMPEPGRYTQAVIDVMGLLEIMDSIPQNLKLCPENTIYEAGLLYLSIRNIGISLSWHTQKDLSFSRSVALELGAPFTPCPLPTARHELYLNARLAGTRGAPSSAFDINTGVLVKDTRACLEWAKTNLGILKDYDKTSLC